MWKETIILDGGGTHHLNFSTTVNFKSNEQNFTKFTSLNGPAGKIVYDTTLAYDYSNLWTNENYRTIKILDDITAVANGYGLLKLLSLDAMRIIVGEDTSSQFMVVSNDYVQNATYLFEQGMTWEEFIDSEYNIGSVFSVGVYVSYSGFQNVGRYIEVTDLGTYYIESRTYTLISHSGGSND